MKKQVLSKKPTLKTDATLATIAGQTRVRIERVSPETNAGYDRPGRYPIKAIAGDTIPVEADIITDGHDMLGARLLFRHGSEKNWQEVPMKLLVNDRWASAFTVEKLGRYHYTIEAWVDHIASWQHEIELKVADGQRISSELLAGAVLVDGMAHRAGGGPNANAADAAALLRTATLFREGSDLSNDVAYQEAVHLAESDQFLDWAQRYPERQHPARYQFELSVEVDRAAAGFSTWYCLFPRSASRDLGPGNVPVHGTFRDVEKLLPRIAGMGFDVLYLPPIHPIGTAHRKGKNNSVTCLPGEPGVPYGIGSAEGGHDAIHAELGTVDDFRHLIAEAKTYGMEIAMDLAIQCSPDHPWATQHPEWFKKRPDGTIQYAENPPKKYQDIYPVYFETDDWQNLWLELKRVLLVWADWGVRIVRVDNPHTKPFEFWEWVIAEVKKHHPDMLFLSEAFTKPKVMQQLAKVGFAHSYTYYTWRTNKAELQQYMTELTAGEMQYYFRPNFWPTTHDINPGILQSGHEPQFLIRYFLAATLSANYGIYGPSFELMEHVPVPNKEEFLNSEKYEIRHWDWERTNKLTYLISLTNRIRRENKALQQTNNLTICRIDDEFLMAYLKVTDANRLLIVVNTDAYNRRAGMVQVPIWQLGIAADQPYTVHDLLTDNHYTWQGEWNFVELDPYIMPMHLFRID
ncbi:alpha-1,4-glucan--maltose-1-phosphate maltosyltransferase [uncultured Fibrella sp.]|uniref:alpha-1,4-glucan--maltose-1-phosphate maltosyltransferase n=1 Tax=uncultured Fibrella sp. TaxID=1284596 RepID=UPI0035C9B92A